MCIDFEAQQLWLQPEALQDTKLTLKPSIKGLFSIVKFFVKVEIICRH